MSRLSAHIAGAIAYCYDPTDAKRGFVEKVQEAPAPDAPPRRLTNVVSHRDFHISFMRVGLRIDGEERNDVHWYDADRGLYSLVGPEVSIREGVVEPFWRYPESRQNRRQRERWEASRK